MQTVYEKLKDELLRPFVIGSGLGNKFDRLIKLQLSTDDEVVVQGIDNIMQHLKEASRLRTLKSYQKSSKEAQIASELMSRMIAYCTVQIESQEPEWMIIARKNGWTPPKE